MPRLRNRATGSIVVVDDATATALGPDYEPADKPSEKPTPKKASAKTAEK